MWKYKKIERALESYKKNRVYQTKGSHNKHVSIQKNEQPFFLSTITTTFKKHIANFASDLIKKYPDTAGEFGILLVRQYSKEFNNRAKKN